jgi:hypothetical protein
VGHASDAAACLHGDRGLVLELLQLLHLPLQQAGVFSLPVEIGRLADSRLPADLSDRNTFITLRSE